MVVVIGFAEQVVVRGRAGVLRRARRDYSRVRCGAVPAYCAPERARASASSAAALRQTLLPGRDVSIFIIIIGRHTYYNDREAM